MGHGGRVAAQTQQAQNGISRPVSASARRTAAKSRPRRESLRIILEKVVSQIFTSWNQMASWLSQLQGLQGAA